MDNTQTPANYQSLIESLNELQNESDIERLDKAVEFYCGEFDKREGLKHALTLCLTDNYENHPHEQDEADLRKLVAILFGE